jgi:hypothetical protein
MHDSVTLQMLHGLGAVVLLLVMRSCDDMWILFARSLCWNLELLRDSELRRRREVLILSQVKCIGQ